VGAIQVFDRQLMRKMKNWGILLTCLFGWWGLSAQKLWVRVSAGGESQDFHWSIAGNSAGQDPNVYSELKWHAVSGPVGRVELLWKPCGRWRVLGGGSRVVVRSGTMTDTDYGLDNRYDPIYTRFSSSTPGIVDRWLRRLVIRCGTMVDGG
jgi:hypothetical protein